MLAKIDWNSAPCEPVADIDYTGFPHWVALGAEPNRERKAADWLKDKLNIHVYWPHYTVQRTLRVPCPWPPRKDGSFAPTDQSAAINDDTNQLGKTG